MKQMFRKVEFNGLPRGINGRQKEAVLHTDGPLLLLAGVGSGYLDIYV